jgi:hypothetical protein
MTNRFYESLLNYITPKERQRLYTVLQKSGARIRGFRFTKNTSLKIIATSVKNNEGLFLKYLATSYKPEYSSKEEAIDAISPETAILCFTYFIKINALTEDDEKIWLPLISSEDKSIDSKNKADQETDQVAKEKKRADEFRQKYLTVKKDLQKLESEYSIAKETTEKLQKDYEAQNKDFLIIKEELLKEKAAYAEYREDAERQIKELKESLAAKIKECVLAQHQVLVLQSTEETDINGISVLTYSRIIELKSLSPQYSEILFVVNDLPFAIKRKLYKMEDLQDKFRAFSTHNELLEYIEKRSAH